MLRLCCQIGSLVLALMIAGNGLMHAWEGEPQAVSSFSQDVSISSQHGFGSDNGDRTLVAHNACHGHHISVLEARVSMDHALARVKAFMSVDTGVLDSRAIQPPHGPPRI
jgi:hypothetical protein